MIYDVLRTTQFKKDCKRMLMPHSLITRHVATHDALTLGTGSWVGWWGRTRPVARRTDATF
jgi:hypothetical protein